MFFVVCIVIFIVAALYVFEKPCHVGLIQNCKIEGLVGLSYVMMWSLMVFMGCYFIYLGVKGLKKEENKIELQSKLRHLFVVVAGLAMFAVPVFWYYVLDGTIDDYNLIHLYDN